MSVLLIVRLEAAAGKADELLAFMREGRESGLRVPGCERFEVYQSEEDPLKMLLVQQWSSRAAHDEYSDKSFRDAGGFERLKKLLKGAPLREYYLAR